MSGHRKKPKGRAKRASSGRSRRNADAKPHDALFKHTFADPAHLASELESVLAPELLAALDLSTLRLIPGSFIDDELKSSHTDLLFEVARRGGDGRALLYLLFEHQSTADAEMTLRLLQYSVRIWRWHLDVAKLGLPLPPILPLVLHHSERGWRVASDFHSIVGFDGWPEALRRHVPQFEVLIDDISRMPEAELLARPLSPEARATLWLLAHARRLLEALERDTTSALLQAISSTHGEEALRPYLSYIAEGVAPGAFHLVLTLVRTRLGPRVEALMNSIADELREEGKKQGMQQGMRAGRVAIVLELLRAKFGRLDEVTVQRIEEAPVDVLDRVAAQILTAATLADALR